MYWVVSVHVCGKQLTSAHWVVVCHCARCCHAHHADRVTLEDAASEALVSSSCVPTLCGCAACPVHLCVTHFAVRGVRWDQFGAGGACAYLPRSTHACPCPCLYLCRTLGGMAFRGYRHLVVAAVAGVCLVGGGAVWATRAREVPQPPAGQLMPMADACVSASNEQLLPLVTVWSGEVRYRLQQGDSWLVSTSVDHKTKWADNWYDVTCVVVLPTLRVASVRSVPRN